jgi:lipopolysaccharide transport system ATP-binding protein
LQTSSDIAIHVENLGKQYRIGALQKNGGQYSYKSLRDSISSAASAPFRMVSGLLGRNGRHENQDEETIWALKDVSFDVKRGEILGVIGRNGAGKSTLLKVLSRITEPSTGFAAIHGRVGSLLEVGTGFHPELTGRDNVYLNGAILGMRRAEINRQFDEIVAFAEVEKFIDTPVKYYSSGMYLRLAFAVAAHLEPEILIVDEVLAVGDAEFQKKCLGKMQSLTSSGRTVVFVSHNMNAVEELCQRIVHLDRGEIASESRDVRTAIARYLKGAHTEAVAAEWSNPGSMIENPWFRPLRFYIGDSSRNVISGPIRNDQTVYLYIEGEVEKLDVALNVGYSIFDETGLLLYCSAHTDSAQQAWPTIKEGSNHLRSPLPMRLLNQGTYRLDLLISLYYREWISNPDHGAPSISLTIQGGLSDSPYWMVRRPGVLAPVCVWSNDLYL